MSKNEDSLRLEYEHHRTFAFAEFAAILVLAFGVISNIHGMKMYVILIFTLTFIALLIGFIASFKSMNRIYSSLKRLYKNKK